MKYLILIYSLLSIVLEAVTLTDPVGTKCTSQGIFSITTCNVTPFPPTAGQSVSVSINGTFTAAARVSQIRNALQGGQMWSYQYEDINQNYPLNTQQNFTYSLQIPQYHDFWLVQITVIGPDSFSILGCWEFAFRD